jgi:uncharacterized MAPEG superfamily protein
MTLAQFCIVLAALLPIACAGIAKAGMFSTPRRDGGYDNHNPRAWLAQQQGYRARANAAQANSFEALPMFIAGVLIAQFNGAPAVWVNGLAVAFVLLRVAYIGAYVADRQGLRSAVWMLGFGTSIALAFTGFFKGA